LRPTGGPEVPQPSLMVETSRLNQPILVLGTHLVSGPIFIKWNALLHWQSVGWENGGF